MWEIIRSPLEGLKNNYKLIFVNEMNFSRAYNILLGFEGEYSNHESDSGGKTKFGITEKLARAYHYEGEMKNLTLTQSKTIARSEFWEKAQCMEVPREIRYSYFDACFNSGQGNGVKMLQRTLGGLKIDGDFGIKTLTAVTDSKISLIAFQRTRIKFYCDIVMSNKTQLVFLRGWMNRVVEISHIE